MQSRCTEHIRFSVHGRGRDNELVELLNTGMMEMCEFMEVSPGRPRAPRHGCSEILLDFGDEVEPFPSLYGLCRCLFGSGEW